MKILVLAALAIAAVTSPSQSVNASPARRCAPALEYGAGKPSESEYAARIQHYERWHDRVVPPGIYFSTPTQFGGGLDTRKGQCLVR